MAGLKWEGPVLGKLGVERKHGMKTILLKAGIALALSFAGYLYSQFRLHNDAAVRRLRLPPPEADPPDGRNSGKQEIGGDSVDHLPPVNHDETNPGFPTQAFTTTSVIASPSATSRSSGDDVGYLLPEFSDLVLEEFEFTTKDTASTRTSLEKSGSQEASSLELEISSLKSLVQSLQERERNLELQLLEYYGLREQEATVRELQNRLKANSMEAKLYNFKIESLQADNLRLKEQMADNVRLVSEVESAREQIKLLERKLKSDADQAKEELASLGKRVAALQECERAEQELEEELQQALTRLEDFKGEVRDLKEENSRLAQENVHFAKKLEFSERSTSDAIKNLQAVIEEANGLRLRNDELTKEIEQIQIDRCSDVEELIYLRWINACLRYELRNYEPLEGKSAARDLNMTLSPKSEEKAKQLILEYAKTGSDEKCILDFDPECCSSSHSSSMTETEEADDASIATNNSHPSSKRKLFSKLKKLVLGKGNHSKKLSLSEATDNLSRERMASGIQAGRSSCDSMSSCITLDHASEHKYLWDDNLFKALAIDRQGPTHLSREEAHIRKGDRCISDLGDSYKSMRFILGERSFGGSPSVGRSTSVSTDSPGKDDLKKFANALKNTRRSELSHKRSKSHGIY